MKKDVSISQVVNIYHRRTDSWERNKFTARHYDAVVYFEEGEIEYYFAHTTVVAKKGDILILPGNLPYNGKRKSETVAFYVMDFLCEDDRQLEELGAPCAFAAKDPNTLKDFQKALSFWIKQTLNTTFHAKATIYCALSMMLQAQNREVTPSSPILDYMAENFQDPTLSVEGICKKFYISDSQLRRLTYKQVNLSANGYIQNLRIRKAQNLLSATDLDIKTVSNACGFSSQYYFSRVFSKLVGVCPSEYRKRTHI